MRRRGEGSVYRRGDGRWVAQVATGELTPRGAPKYSRRIRSSEDDAVTALRELQRDQDRGVHVDGNMTVGSYLTWWMDNVKAGTVSEGTEDDYRALLRNHVVPAIGRKRLRQLSKADVLGMVRKMANAGLSKRTQQYAVTPLRLALDWAVDEGMLPKNVASKVAPTPPKRRRQKDRFTRDQARAILEEAKGDRLEGLAHLYLKLGLRRGEGLAIFWPDAQPAEPLLLPEVEEWSTVDLENGRLHVATTLRRRNAGRPGPRLYIKDAKTEASSGTLPLVAGLEELLRDHRRRQAEERLAAGPTWQGHGLVFANEVGAPLSPYWVGQTWWKGLCERAGVEAPTVHQARRTCGTLLLEDGVPLEVVSAILRHSGLSITADVYAGVTMDSKRRELARWEDVL